MIVLSCAVCGILFATGASFLSGVIGRVAGPTYTVSQYYNAIEKRDYPTAYSYLSTNATIPNGQTLTQTLYTTNAQVTDVAKEPVSNYSIGTISLTNNITNVTVSVTRGSPPAYPVHLQLQQVNGSWKIISYDNI